MALFFIRSEVPVNEEIGSVPTPEPEEETRAVYHYFSIALITSQLFL